MTKSTTCVALIALSAVLAGCDVKPRKEKVIRVVRNVGSRQGFRRHWETWKRAFERDNPGWEMELVNAGDAQVKQYYMQRIAGNDMPPVIQTWGLTRFLADNGHILAIPDEYYHTFGLPLPEPYKGGRYATMGSVQLQGIAVNRRLWREIGITSPPETWDAFEKALRALKSRGHTPMTYAALDWCAAVPLAYALFTNLYEHRADTFDPAKASWTRRRDERKTLFATDPVARRIMRRITAFVSEFADGGSLSDGYDEAKSEFYSGRTGCWLMGCWIGGDLEPCKVEFEIDYWPIPSMVSRTPVFLTGSYLQTGWSVTSGTKGPLREKAYAVLSSFYDPESYQTWLNAESMIPTASKVAGVTGPQSSWPPARHFYDSMLASYKQYGATRGDAISMADQPPTGIETVFKEVMQEVLTGNRDTDAMLKKIDAAWDSLRRAERASQR